MPEEIQRPGTGGNGKNCIQLSQIQEIVEGREAKHLYPSPRQYAVLIPLLERDGQLHILFEVRQSGIRQGGEVCFPGGEIEEGESAQNAAVRETAEELLIEPDTLEVMAPMYEMMGPGGVRVAAFLGFLKEYGGTFSEREVDHVFSVPLSFFAENPAKIHQSRFKAVLGEDFPAYMIPGGINYPFKKIPRQYYFYQTNGEVIWGMTAELLYNFLRDMAIAPEPEPI